MKETKFVQRPVDLVRIAHKRMQNPTRRALVKALEAKALDPTMCAWFRGVCLTRIRNLIFDGRSSQTMTITHKLLHKGKLG